MSDIPPPLNGQKTHPLTPHALEVLRRLVQFGPQPAQEINAGVVNRFARESLVDRVQLPSPYKTHKGRKIDFLQINAAGRAALTRHTL